MTASRKWFIFIVPGDRLIRKICFISDCQLPPAIQKQRLKATFGRFQTANRGMARCVFAFADAFCAAMRRLSVSVYFKLRIAQAMLEKIACPTILLSI
jgi:hypothetical protein